MAQPGNAQTQRAVDDAIAAFSDPDASPTRLRAALGAALLAYADVCTEMGLLLLGGREGDR